MNLTKLFNIKYLLQNLKKSKVVLSIFIGLIPILNTIILIMQLTNNSNYVLNFAELSIINLIGIYILPIIISICLFNYIYKRKSVDFINSMPISRKSIFVTNTILGIIIFTLMLIINIILILIVTNIFNAPVPFMMLVDYFWFYLIVYIFAFVTTNLAMTISGNAITQIVVTLLLLFLVPFTTAYTNELANEFNDYNILIECKNEECMPKKYFCYDDMECNINKELNRYVAYLYPIRTNNYTPHFGLIYSSMTSQKSIINITKVIKMIILSIIYIILGYKLFIKRKMEVSETSFKNIHVHNLVKSLTLVPMISFAYIILRSEEVITMIFVVVIMLIYFFVYDLITKKSITNLKLSCLYFLITTVLLTSIFQIINNDNNKLNILKYDDIKEVAIDIGDYVGRDNEIKLYTTNKELKSIIVKGMLNQDDDSSEYLNIYLKDNKNQEFQVSINLTKEDYTKVITMLEKEKKYLSTYKNINLDEVYALEIGDKVYKNKEAKPYLKLINDSLSKLSLKEFIDLQQKYNYVDSEYYINLYTYENHDRQQIAINGYINYKLLNSIVNSNNQLLKNNLTKSIPENYYIYYENSYLKEQYIIDFYTIRSAKNELYDFIYNNINDEVDMKEEYFSFQIELNGNIYHFTTNKIEEIKNIINNKYEEIKDSQDYKDYYKNEDEEYYD